MRINKSQTVKTNKGYEDSNLEISITTNQSNSKVLCSAGLMRVVKSGEPISHCVSVGLISILVIRLHDVVE